MDCSGAGPFVSAVYDAEVPLEAVQHIAECTVCQTRLEDYSVITTDLQALAAREPLRTAYIPVLRGRSWWLHWSTALYVPRLVAAIFVVALIAASAGWLRLAAAETRSIPCFAFRLGFPSDHVRGPLQILTEGSIGSTQVNEKVAEGYRPLATKTRVISISGHTVVLEIQLKHFSDTKSPMDTAEMNKGVDESPVHRITYTPGRNTSISFDDGNAVLSGSILYKGKHTATDF